MGGDDGGYEAGRQEPMGDPVFEKGLLRIDLIDVGRVEITCDARPSWCAVFLPMDRLPRPICDICG